MKIFFSKTAFTLMELIIATVLVAVILLGIFAINMVLSNNNQDYGQRYLVKSETQTTLNHILYNASLAVGSANTDANGIPNDQGILWGGDPNGWGDPNSFCIHQNQSGDQWFCYTWIPSPTYQIKYCTENYTSGSGVSEPRGAVSCNSGSANITSGPTYLGTAFSMGPPTFTATGSQLLFSIQLQNCLNDFTNPETCNASGTSGDPYGNPEQTLSGSVIPQQVST